MATVPLFCLDGSVSPHHLSAMNVTMKSEDEEEKGTRIGRNNLSNRIHKITHECYARLLCDHAFVMVLLLQKCLLWLRR